MNNLIVAPNYIDLKDKPIIFLAGPIQGTFDWQSIAASYLSKKILSGYIASPRRSIKFQGEFKTDMYNKQVDWETHHLRHAGSYGVILFWLAKESEHDCKRAYAQTTRFELAEWKVLHKYNNAKIVIGIEEGFTGAKYIRRRFNQDCPDVVVCSTLEETCNQAINLLK